MRKKKVLLFSSLCAFISFNLVMSTAVLDYGGGGRNSKRVFRGGGFFFPLCSNSRKIISFPAAIEVKDVHNFYNRSREWKMFTTFAENLESGRYL